MAGVAVYPGGAARDLSAPALTVLPDDPSGWMGFGEPSLLVADLDLDGHLDVATHHFDQTVVVLSGAGDGTFTPTSSTAQISGFSLMPAAPDLNADGYPDLMAVQHHGTIQVALSTGAGGFAFAPVTVQQLPDTLLMDYQLVDLDLDGELDMVFGADDVYAMGRPTGVFVVRGLGGGSFAAAPELLVAGRFSGAAVVDLNEDGVLDIATTDSAARQVVVLLGRGDGTVVAGPDTHPVGTTIEVTAGDVDGDGALDLHTFSYDDSRSRVLSFAGLAAAPAVTTQPVDAVVASGTTATLTAVASGTPAPTVQWESSTDGTTWAPVSGATSDTLTTPTVDPSTSGTAYRAVFTNGSGSDTTDPAVVTVAVAPVVTLQPEDQDVAPGDDATFTAAATGDPAPGVQWQLSSDEGATFTDLAGEVSPTLTVTTTSADDGNRYRAVFTNLGGQTTTAAAALAVTSVPVGATPSVPLDVVVTQTGEHQVTITWSAPADAGSSPLTGYDVGYGTGAWGNGETVSATTYSAVFDDLDHGDYTAAVTATNAVGDGVRALVPFAVGPLTAPGGVTGGGAGGGVLDRGTQADRVPDPTDDELARTGLDVLDGLGVAALSLSLGALMVAAGRRRRHGVRTA